MSAIHDTHSGKKPQFPKKGYDNNALAMHDPTHLQIQQSVRRSLEQIKTGDVMGIDEAFKQTMESYRS